MSWLTSALGIVAGAVLLNKIQRQRNGAPFEEDENPQFRTTPEGVVYPLRGTDGPGGVYDDGKVRGGKVDSAWVDEEIAKFYDSPNDPHRTIERLDKIIHGDRSHLFGRYKTVDVPTAKAARDELRPIIEKRQKIQDELGDVLKAQRELYQGDLTPEQRAAAGKKYAQLKARERQLTDELTEYRRRRAFG